MPPPFFFRFTEPQKGGNVNPYVNQYHGVFHRHFFLEKTE